MNEKMVKYTHIYTPYFNISVLSDLLTVYLIKSAHSQRMRAAIIEFSPCLSSSVLLTDASKGAACYRLNNYVPSVFISDIYS